MKYLVNRVTISLLVDEVIKENNGYKLITKIPNKPDITLIAFIHLKKLKGMEIEVNKVYEIDGYLASECNVHKNKLHKLQLNIDQIEPNKNGSYSNNVEVTGEFISKTKPVILRKGSKVCNLKMDYLSENLKDSQIEIAVWNGAVDALDLAVQGQKLNIHSFILGNFCTGNTTSIKLSPFKVNLL